jgi:CheY-like chemotaxis protein
MEEFRALIVDGHAETRDALALAFFNLRCSVLSRSSLAQGLLTLIPWPDGVVIDLVPPDGRGEEIRHAIRTVDAAESSTPVVAFTIETDSNRLGAVVKHRPDVLLLRPIDPENVARMRASE